MFAFVPNLCLEEEVPIYAKECKDCGLYKHGTRMVWGEGNPKAPILITYFPNEKAHARR